MGRTRGAEKSTQNLVLRLINDIGPNVTVGTLRERFKTDYDKELNSANAHTILLRLCDFGFLEKHEERAKAGKMSTTRLVSFSITREGKKVLAAGGVKRRHAQLQTPFED